MDTIKCFYHCRDINNFGDIVGPWVIEKELGIKTEWYNDNDVPVIFPGGSQMQDVHENSIVLGCGFGAPDQVCVKPLFISSVRGKLTRQRLLELNIECPEYYYDLTYKLPDYFSTEHLCTKMHKIGYIPHYVDFDLFKVEDCFSKYHVIDICSGVENVVHEVLQCEQIYSSSLHGLILAHAFDIPFKWKRTINEIASPEWKFKDWASGFDIELQVE